LFASRALGHDWGSLSASFGRLSTWGDGTRSISSLSWVRSFRDFSLSVSAVRSSNTASVQIGLSIPLSNRGFFSSSLQKRDSITTWRSDYASAPLTGNGLAVRAGMTKANAPGAEDMSSAVGALDARTDFGEHGVQVDSRGSSTSWRVRTAGSLGVLAGHTFWGPPISNGFALVSTGDAPSIPVYRWNLPVAVSDARGLALVTSLSPYRKNLLAIRPDEVPLEYRVTDHEVTAVPRGRGGVFVAFSMLRERPALLTLHLPDGQPVPSGATALILGTGESATVGQRGEVYLQNVPEHAEVEIIDNNQRCRVTPSRLATTDPQPRLGPFICALRVVP
jgi:outer membrane usher protein